jgi:transposase
MDNLAAHKAERVRAALDAAGIAYRYLPAYSPDLNPCMDDPRSARALSA